MKTFIITLAAAAALVSPALAHAPMHARAEAQDMYGMRAQAAPAAGANAVFAAGAYLGADPDPQVRLQLMRNAGFENR